MSDINIVIVYCTQCQWLLRAAWMAQELLSTFSTDLGEVALQPGTGGVFQVSCDGELLWDRKRDGGFPDAKTLKQRVRDLIDPSRPLATWTVIAGPGRRLRGRVSRPACGRNRSHPEQDRADRHHHSPCRPQVRHMLPDQPAA